jgi:hypothetical protein
MIIHANRGCRLATPSPRSSRYPTSRGRLVSGGPRSDPEEGKSGLSTRTTEHTSRKLLDRMSPPPSSLRCFCSELFPSTALLAVASPESVTSPSQAFSHFLVRQTRKGVAALTSQPSLETKRRRGVVGHRHQIRPKPVSDSSLVATPPYLWFGVLILTPRRAVLSQMVIVALRTGIS